MVLQPIDIVVIFFLHLHFLFFHLLLLFFFSFFFFVGRLFLRASVWIGTTAARRTAARSLTRHERYKLYGVKKKHLVMRDVGVVRVGQNVLQMLRRVIESSWNGQVVQFSLREPTFKNKQHYFFKGKDATSADSRYSNLTKSDKYIK